MEVDWNQYPHLEEAHRNALLRMSQSLGVDAANEVLRMLPPHQLERLNAFVKMEQMYSATAQRAFEEAEAQLRRKAEEQLQLEAQRLTDEQRRETERILMDRERLHAEASQREAERLLMERERLQHEAEIRVRAAESQVAATVEAAVAAALAANAQHSRGPNTERRKAVKLDVPKYSGKDTENLEHWFLAVETAAAAQLLDDQAIIVVFAMSHLMGRAKEWAYSKRLLNRNAFPTWESFCLELRQTFQPPDNQFRNRARLLACKQGKRTLHEFVHELQSLRASLTTEVVPETMLVSIFLEGLRQGPARLQLFRDIPGTLDDAIRIAFMEEYSHRSAGRGQPTGPSPMDINGLQRQPEGRDACHNCGKKGHWARDCRQPKKGQGGNRRDSNQRNPPRFQQKTRNSSQMPASKGTALSLAEASPGNGESQ
jgi:hypothetical protein